MHQFDLGNSWPHLHAHVHARYAWEPPEHRDKPVWTYPDPKDPRYRLDHRHTALRADLVRELTKIATEAYGELTEGRGVNDSSR